MKKLVLGIAVCCGVSGANGMDTTLVNDVVSNPFDRSSLTRLVSKVMSNNQETLQARNYVHSKIDQIDQIDQSEGELTPKTLQLYRICSMLYQLSRDIRSDEVNWLNYYVYGAINGSFGPYLD